MKIIKLKEIDSTHKFALKMLESENVFECGIIAENQTNGIGRCERQWVSANGNLYSSVMGDVVTKILPVMDNLEKAAQAETSDEKYKEGIIMCLNQFKDVLAACNVTEIKTVGEKFDPSLHEAVSSVVDDNLGEKVIKEEYRKGYKIGDRVIRHSLVVVAN